jgi:hypothetical protein
MEKGSGVWPRRISGVAGILLLTLVPVGALGQTQILPSSLPPGQYGVAYTTTTFTIIGASAPTFSWAAQSGSILPPGLTLTSGGVLSGTPTRGGTFAVTVSGLISPTANPITQPYSIIIASSNPTITSGPTLPVAVQGQAYNVQLAATGGSPFPSPAPSYFWQVSDNPLPPGLSLGVDGRITGTVDAAATPGQYTSYITATDNTYPVPQYDLTGLTIYVDSLMTITTVSPLADALRGVAYSRPFAVSGGTSPFVFTVTGGTLPPGITVTSAGLASGTPTTAGTYTFTLTVLDAVGQSVSKSFTQTIVIPLAISTTSPLPNGEQGVPYNLTFAATGGRTPIAWTLFSGALPGGLTLASNGALSGTPTANGTFPFVVQVTDSFSPTPQVVRLSASLTVAAGLTITPATVPSTIVGTPYSQTLGTSGGQGAITWSISAGVIPPGLTFVNGVISGTSITAGSYNFTVQAVDALGGIATRSYTVTVAPPLSISNPATLPAAVSGNAYSQAFTAAGGNPSYLWSIASNSTPPPGLTMSSTGVLSGTAGAVGSYPFIVQVTDNSTPAIQVATRPYTLVIGSAITITTASPLPSGVVATPYSVTLANTGGTGPYTWSTTPASLPAGLSLTGAVLGGTPTAAGTTTFTVQVTDSLGQQVSKSLQVTIANRLTITSASPLPVAQQGAPYTFTFASTGGTGGVTWTAANPPPGLTLSPGGVLSGTPSGSGSFTFSVQATDSAIPAQTATANFTLVEDPPITIQTTSIPAAIATTPYTTTFAATGGTAPLSYTLQSVPPPGLSLNATSGVLSGTVATAATYPLTLVVTDTHGLTANRAFSLVVVPKLQITTTSLPDGREGRSYFADLTATGGTGIYAWTATAPLPQGLTLSGATISGTTATAGTYSIAVQVTDSQGPIVQTATATLTLTVGRRITITSTSPLPNGAVGKSYSQQLNAAFGVTPYFWDVSSGALPAGFTLTSTGILFGTPTAPGTFTFKARVFDATEQSAEADFSLTISPQLSITTTSPLPAGNQNVAYTPITFAVTGGLAPYTWTVASGALPAGLSLSTQGVLSGTPTGAGASTFVVQVADTNGSATQTVTASFSLTVNSAIVITTASPLPGAITGQSYSRTFAATGGTPPFTWALAGGTLPAGWTLTAAGVLSGSATVAGTYNFVVKAADGVGGAGTKDFAVTVASPLAITTSTLPVAFQNSAYPPQTLAASGGTTPFNWSVTSGSLPAGITLTNAGVLAGTPTASGSFTFTVQAADSAVANPQTATRQLSITVDPQLTITTGSPLPYATGGVAYNQTLAAAGGTAPYTWTIASGSLPAGFALSQAGAITGTSAAAAAATNYTFTAQVTDGPGQVVTKAFTLALIPPLSVDKTVLPPTAVLNTSYSHSLTATGGTAPYAWALTSGRLPAGLSLSSAGVLTGTPTAAGSFPFDVTVTDQSPGIAQTATASFTIVAGVTISITTAAPGSGVVGKPYSLTLAATGGTGTLTWSFANPAPSWLSITAAGVVNGTPPAAGSYEFTVRVADTQGLSATKLFTLPVTGPLSITTTSLTDAVTNVAYAATFAAAGGKSPYTWSITTGALPAGLALAAEGTLSGTPTIPGIFDFTVQVKDSSTEPAQTATTAFTLRVQPPLAITTSIIGGAQFGLPYAVSLGATGGVQPYNWTLLNGGVPGLILTSTGLFSGTPTLAGTFTMVVRLGDATTATVVAALQVTVAPALLTIITPSPLPAAVVNSPYSVVFSAIGAPPPYTFTVDSGDVPPGLFLTPSGVLSGTATQVGFYTFAVRASNGIGPQASTTVRSFALTVQQTDLSVTTFALNGAVSGQFFAQQLTATGGLPPYVWSLAGGTLPANITIAASGLVSGTPPTPGTFPIAVRVTDSTGVTATRALQFSVTESAVQITTAELPGGRVGTGYSFAVTAVGGQPGYTFQLAAGSVLPAGLSLLPNGTITGTPVAIGVYNFGVTAQDTAGASATRALSLAVLGRPLTITNVSPLPESAVGQAYSTGLAALGGLPPFLWSGSGLPPGLTLGAATGTVSGIPTAAGPFAVAVTVTDAEGTTIQGSFVLIVRPPLLTISTPSNLGSIPIGGPASLTLGTTGGAPPYSWLVLSGNPGGLTLSSGGVLSGTPPVAGTYNFTVQVSDSAGAREARQFTLTIVLAPLRLNSVTPPAASAGSSYAFNLGATGGTQPYLWSASGLPEGLTLNPGTGAITGTPTLGGPFTITVSVTDGSAQVATSTIGLNVTVPPLPPATLAGPPATVAPLEQPPLRLNLNGTLPIPVEGEIRLTFTPDRGAPDPSVQFATGGTVVRFNIPAGANLAQFAIPNMAVQTGSVAGTIVLTATFRAAGLDITPAPPPSATIRVDASVPGIRSVTAVRTTSGFTVTIVGFASSREITQGTFRFNAAAGSALQTNEIVIPVAQLFVTWFTDAQSQPYGSQFTFVQAFNVQGDTSAVASVTVTLSNTLGPSTPVTATLQ